MLSAVLEEEPDLYEAFPPHVDPSGITILTDSPPGNTKVLIPNYFKITFKMSVNTVICELSYPIIST